MIKVDTRRIIKGLLHSQAGRIGCVGWTGHHNLGDEAVFEGVQKLLPDYSIVPYQGRGRDNYLRNMTFGPYLRGCCLSGGTLIYSGLTNLRALEAAEAEGLAMFCLGTGVIDPVWKGDDKEFKERQVRYDRLLKDFRYIGVRGPRSAEILRERGFDNVEVTGDTGLVFSGLGVKSTQERPCLGVNLGTANGNVRGKSEEHILPVLVKALQEFKANGWQIMIFSVWPKDTPVCRKLAIELGLPKSSVRMHYHCATDYTTGAARCSVFVGFKLHSVILAQAGGVPSIMLSYQPKCSDHMAAMGQIEYDLPVDELRADEIADKISHAYENRSPIRQQLEAKCRYYLNKLENGADLVAQVI